MSDEYTKLRLRQQHQAMDYYGGKLWQQQQQQRILGEYGMAREVPWDPDDPELSASTGDVNAFMAKQVTELFNYEERDMLTQLKNLVVARLELDDALALLVFADSLKKGYEAYEIPQPKWLPENMSKLDEFIREKRATGLRRAVEKARSVFESLRPLEERRGVAEVELQRLKKELDATLGKKRLKK